MLTGGDVIVNFIILSKSVQFVLDKIASFTMPSPLSYILHVNHDN